MVSKFIANIFILALVVGTQITVMIYGWGLKPRSWWWIIGVGFFVNMFLLHVAERLKKESA